MVNDPLFVIPVAFIVVILLILAALFFDGDDPKDKP